MSDQALDKTPAAARVSTTLMSMLILVVVAVFITRRTNQIRSWNSLSFSSYIVLLAYVDTLIYVVASAIMSRDFLLNASLELCDATIIMCFCTIFAAKGLVYLFTVEKVHIVRGTRQARYRDKLYIFNILLVVIPGIGLMIWSFIDRIAFINVEGMCVIGAHRGALIPILIFDAVMNLYITTLFVHPLRKLYASGKTVNPLFRRMAVRAFVGSCVAIVSSATNLAVLAGLNGEYGWACLMSCHVDALITISCLHWASAMPADLQEPSRSLPMPMVQEPVVKGWAPDATWQTGGFSCNVPTVMSPDDLPDIHEMGPVGMGTAISHQVGPKVMFTTTKVQECAQIGTIRPTFVTECGHIRSRSDEEQVDFGGILVEQERNVVVEDAV